jgi:hypothetical protein
MHPGITLTVTLPWPFRLAHVVGDSIRIGKAVIVSGAGQQLRLTAVKPGATIIKAVTPQSAAPGPPSGPVWLFANVST